MKITRLPRLLVIALAYTVLLFCLFAMILPWLNNSSPFDNDSLLLEITIFVPLLLLPLYAILYKQNWINTPAKIIFPIIFIWLIYFSIDSGIYSYFIIQIFLTAIALVCLFKNDIKHLKEKPSDYFKNLILKIIPLLYIVLVIYFWYTAHTWENKLSEDWYSNPSLHFQNLTLTYIKALVKTVMAGGVAVATIWLLNDRNNK